MDMQDLPTAPAKAGFIDRLLFKLAAVDEEILRRCPPIDWSHARAIGEIMLFVFVYLTAIFFNLAYRLWGNQNIPFEILGAATLSAFVVAIDSYMVNRSAWYAAGVKELKKAGIDLSDGHLERVKAAFILVVRIFLLSIPLAQLSGLFFALMVFFSTIHQTIYEAWLHANAAVIQQVTTLVDGQIHRATDAEVAQAARVATLAKQITAARQNEIADPQIQQAEKEINQLFAEKVKADQDAHADQDFAADELGGAHGHGHTGHPGNGPMHRAAEQKADDAAKHAQDVGKELDAARARLDALRKQPGASGGAAKQQAAGQLTHLETVYKAENARLDSLKGQLSSLTKGRDAAIRKGVEGAPNYVPVDEGLLAQITVLEDIAEKDHRKAALILLLDLCSFGLELAAVLLKVTCYVPTTYCAILVYEHYMRIVGIADRMSEELNRGQKQEEKDAGNPSPEPSDATPHDVTDAKPEANPFETPNGDDDPPPPPPKRPRGRPRKSNGQMPTNAIGSIRPEPPEDRPGPM